MSLTIWDLEISEQTYPISVLTDNMGTFWFKASDITTLLNYVSPRDIIRKFIPVEYQISLSNLIQKLEAQKIKIILPARYEPTTKYLYSAGVLELLFRSNKPIARIFHKRMIEYLTQNCLSNLSSRLQLSEEKRLAIEADNVRKDLIIADLSLELQSKDQVIQSKESELQSKESRLQLKESELQSKESELQWKKSALLEKDQIIQQKDSELQLKDQIIQCSHSELQARAELIESTRSAIELRNGTINTLKRKAQSLEINKPRLAVICKSPRVQHQLSVFSRDVNEEGKTEYAFSRTQKRSHKKATKKYHDPKNKFKLELFVKSIPNSMNVPNKLKEEMDFQGYKSKNNTIITSRKDVMEKVLKIVEEAQKIGE